MSTTTRRLEHRTNNAYDTILLIEDGRAISAWTTTRDDQHWSNYLIPGDLREWDSQYLDGDDADPDNYGDLVEMDDNGRNRAILAMHVGRHIDDLPISDWDQHYPVIDGNLLLTGDVIDCNDDASDYLLYDGRALMLRSDAIEAGRSISDDESTVS